MDTVMIRSREYTYSQTIGRGSAGGNGFSEPVDIAIDGNVVYGLSRASEGDPTARVTVFNRS